MASSQGQTSSPRPSPPCGHGGEGEGTERLEAWGSFTTSQASEPRGLGARGSGLGARGSGLLAPVATRRRARRLAAMRAASYSVACSTAANSGRPDASSTAIAVDSAHPVPRGLGGPALRGRVNWPARPRRSSSTIGDCRWSAAFFEVASLDQHRRDSGCSQGRRRRASRRPLFRPDARSARPPPVRWGSRAWRDAEPARAPRAGLATVRRRSTPPTPGRPPPAPVYPSRPLHQRIRHRRTRNHPDLHRARHRGTHRDSQRLLDRVRAPAFY